MVAESQVKELHAFLSSFPIAAVNAALRRWGHTKREDRFPSAETGWAIWDGEGLPGKPHEWRQIGGTIFYRMPPDPGESTTVSAAVQRQAHQGGIRATATTKICPDCGAQAFAQAVCPKCAKGKAGIRKQWVCGEHDDHVFYTE